MVKSSGLILDGWGFQGVPPLTTTAFSKWLPGFNMDIGSHLDLCGVYFMVDYSANTSNLKVKQFSCLLVKGFNILWLVFDL